MPYKNKEDAKKYYDKWYELNRDKVIEKSRAQSKIRRKEKQLIVLDYLKSHPCIDCGFSDPRALDFDHVKGDKIDNITAMARDGRSTIKLQIEMSKCEVRCANCHRIVTYERCNGKSKG